MTDPNQNSPAGVGKTGVEDTEKYLVRGSRRVIPLLKSLTKKPDLITVKIPGSENRVITAVLDLLPGKNLIILDYGPNESLNKKLLAAERIICTTRHDMVETRFNCNDLKQVKYKGAPAFAAPIPTSVFYLERREYFRIKPLISYPAFISLTTRDERLLKFKILDIGIKGLSMQDTGFNFEHSEGDRFENCTLTLPANPSVTVEFEICYKTDISTGDGDGINRVGGRFIGLSQGEEFTLQRFINMVQIEQHAMVKG